MITDWHAHWHPARFADVLDRAMPGVRPLWAPTDADRQVAAMDDAGIARQVVSLSGYLGVEALPPVEASTLARAFNRETAELVERRGDRFSALAALPFSDVDLALGELEWCVSHTALAGFSIPCDLLADLEMARRLAPVFRKANAEKLHVFVHGAPHRPGPAGSGDNAKVRRSGLEAQHRLAMAAVTLLMTDFVEPYPDLSVQIASLGGTLPFLAERIELVSSQWPRPGNVVMDTATFGRHAITHAVRAIGADHLVFGSDSPVYGAQWHLAELNNADISGLERKTILRRNFLR